MYIRERSCATIFPENKDAGGIHPYHELLYVSSGEGKLRWSEHQYSAGAGCLFLLTPNTPHHFVACDKPCRIWYIECDMHGTNGDLAYRDAVLWNSQQNTTGRSTPYDQPIRNTIELLNSNFLLDERLPVLQEIHDEIFRLTVQQLLLLIHCFLEACRTESALTPPLSKYGETESATTQQIVYKVMRAIESGYKRKVSIKKLSARAHLDSSYLVRLYREQFGSTPLKYLHELRMSAAKCYLAETAMTVQEIADATGYSSIHYFSRLFKQRFQVTPTEWRKQETVGKESK